MTQKGLIIQASARSEGDTNKVVNLLKAQTQFEVLDLNTKNINHFSYDFKNENDDFKSIFKHMVTNYDTIVFATPVYWYSMSGILKVFFDRISDFLYHEKDFGRQLRGMQMASISCNNNSLEIEGFNLPFIKTAEYLGMSYKGHLHTWTQKNTIDNEVNNRINNFAKQLLAKA